MEFQNEKKIHDRTKVEQYLSMFRIIYILSNYLNNVVWY